MCNGEGFVIDFSKKDEWLSSGDKYRLVNFGSGPDVLEIFKDGIWKEESIQYRWSTLTNRIKELLEKSNNAKNDNS